MNDTTDESVAWRDLFIARLMEISGCEDAFASDVFMEGLGEWDYELDPAEVADDEMEDWDWPSKPMRVAIP